MTFEVIHGEAGCAPTTEYVTWSSMLQRCYDKGCKAYPHYGERGIKVCDRWRYGENGKHGLTCFIEDMGRRPSSKHSIDRYPNNDGDYEPANCRWATRKEQANNRRDRRNTVGLPGAQPCRGKFKAQIRRNGQTIHLGVFNTASEASAVYLKAKSLMPS